MAGPLTGGSAESSADLDDRPLLHELRIVAAVADFHRQLPDLDLNDRTPARPASHDYVPENWGTSGCSSGLVEAHMAKCSARGTRGSIARSRSSFYPRALPIAMRTAP
jgi:hypothetical protein